RHLRERNAGEQRTHVVDRIDRDPCHAHVAGDARMVGVVATVGGEIEGNRETLLHGGKIAMPSGVIHDAIVPPGGPTGGSANSTFVKSGIRVMDLMPSIARYHAL